jgi:hypothetical protein
MRNIWKGLFVGALAGAAVGLALDVMYGAGDQLAGATREARRRAPDAADWAATVTADARRALRDTDVPEQVRTLAQAIADSDFAHQVADATAGAAVTGRRVVRNAVSNMRNGR